MDRTKPMRNSNIELYRIVLMLIIIAHHYVVNSGIMDSITKQNALNYKSVFSSVFGWGGEDRNRRFCPDNWIFCVQVIN